MIPLFSLSTTGNCARREGNDSAKPVRIGLARLVLLEVQRSTQPGTVHHSVGIPSQNELLVPHGWRNMEAQTPPCPLPLLSQAQAATRHPPAQEQGL